MVYWKIKFKSKAEKQLNNLDKQSKQKIQTYFNERILKLNHHKESGKALSRNKKGLWRYRVDKFRILCKLEENNLVILVVKIAKRDVVYED